MLKNRTDILKIPRRKRDENLHRKDILEAAERVFIRKGFRSATISDVATEAEFGIGTIYKFFRNKDELFMLFIEEKTGDLVNTLKAATEKASNPKEKIEAFVTAQLQYFHDNKELYRIFSAEAPLFEQSLEGRMGSEFRARLAEYVNYVQGIISEGVRTGSFRSVKHKAATHAAMGIVYLAVQHWSLYEPESDLLSWKDSLLDVIFHGILK